MCSSTNVLSKLQRGLRWGFSGRSAHAGIWIWIFKAHLKTRHARVHGTCDPSHPTMIWEVEREESMVVDGPASLASARPTIKIPVSKNVEGNDKHIGLLSDLQVHCGTHAPVLTQKYCIHTWGVNSVWQWDCVYKLRTRGNEGGEFEFPLGVLPAINRILLYGCTIWQDKRSSGLKSNECFQIMKSMFEHP